MPKTDNKTTKKPAKKTTKKSNKKPLKQAKPKQQLLGENYIKQKKLVKETAKTQPLNTLRFETNYFDIMKNEWLIDSYILERGLHEDDAYSNTLDAYKKAVKAKLPTTMAVQLTSDGVAIVYKHSTLAKLGGNGYVTNSKYDEIKDLTIVGTENEHVPTLQDVLKVIGGKINIIVEVINPNASIHSPEETVLDLIDKYMTKYDLTEGVAVMSINPFVLEWFATHAPHLPRILKSGKFTTKKYGNIKTRHLRKLKYHTEAQADYIAYPMELLPTKHIKKTRPVGVLAYRVYDQNSYQKVAKYCDNIIYSGFEPTI